MPVNDLGLPCELTFLECLVHLLCSEIHLCQDPFFWHTLLSRQSIALTRDKIIAKISEYKLRSLIDLVAKFSVAVHRLHVEIHIAAR